uniref:Putative secreted protein n=1 Tax=Panstrongylus lignarius TaxID=156445 RepID=A0A224Y4A1_9HEMI
MLLRLLLLWLLSRLWWWRWRSRRRRCMRPFPLFPSSSTRSVPGRPSWRCRPPSLVIFLSISNHTRWSTIIFRGTNVLLTSSGGINSF